MDTINGAIPFILSIFVLWKVAEYLEIRQFWTLRLRLSIIEHWFLIPSITIAWAVLLQAFLFQLPPSLEPFRFSIALICTTGTIISFFEYVLPAYDSRQYLQLRWKAWGGPSRTAIRPDLVQYIGDWRDWETLDRLTHGRVTTHPIERFGRFSFFPFSSRLIITDPTDLLLTRSITDQKENTLWAPQSATRHGLFKPILPNESASLLWGEHLGFQRRCSRAIISLPRDLLCPWPKLANGVDARGFCLASGILGRNKGLHPTSFICNLQTKGMIGVFEQNSVFWPRPSKTLRSLFRKECETYFSGLGDVFVTVATELALLLNDAPIEVVEDWLDARLEHQDLELNNEAHALGAQPPELELLYRGHYAAMLVSLSAHRVGVRIRPEMLVYDAVCKSVGAGGGAWSMWVGMEERRQQELEALGPRVINLVDAII